jgi:hypothetical protein
MSKRSRLKYYENFKASCYHIIKESLSNFQSNHLSNVTHFRHYLKYEDLITVKAF